MIKQLSILISKCDYINNTHEVFLFIKQKVIIKNTFNDQKFQTPINVTVK